MDTYGYTHTHTNTHIHNTHQPVLPTCMSIVQDQDPWAFLLLSSLFPIFSVHSSIFSHYPLLGHLSIYRSLEIWSEGFHFSSYSLHCWSYLISLQVSYLIIPTPIDAVEPCHSCYKVLLASDFFHVLSWICPAPGTVLSVFLMLKEMFHCPVASTEIHSLHLFGCSWTDIC